MKIVPETSEIETVAKFLWEKTEDKPWFVLHYYSNQLHLCRINHSSFGYGFSSEYKIFIIDAKGKTIRIIENTKNLQHSAGKKRS